MITTHGDITTLKRGLVLHQVNCQGYMNSGVAKAIRERWPFVFEEYSKICNPILNSRLIEGPAYHLGRVQLVQPVEDEDLYVGNLFGQETYYQPGDEKGLRYTSYDALDRAFTLVAGWNRDRRLPVHFPLIGSDRGGAHWPVIRAMIEHRLGQYDLFLWLLPGAKEPT